MPPKKPPAESSPEDRRKNFELRERLDELMALARRLSQRRSEMSKEELEEARLRVEWLAEEIWGAAVYGPIEQPGGQEGAASGEDPEP